MNNLLEHEIFFVFNKNISLSQNHMCPFLIRLTHLLLLQFVALYSLAFSECLMTTPREEEWLCCSNFQQIRTCGHMSTYPACEHVCVCGCICDLGCSFYSWKAVFFSTAFWSVKATYGGESERVIPLPVLWCQSSDLCVTVEYCCTKVSIFLVFCFFLLF